MRLFTSTKELSERVADLEIQLTAAQEKADSATELEREMAELRAGFDTERNEFQAKLDGATGELETAKTTIGELEAKVTDLTEKATLTAEKVSLEAARQLAASGHPPVEGISAEQDKPDPYAGKSKKELEAIAHNMRNDPKAQKAFVTKYLIPLTGNQ